MLADGQCAICTNCKRIRGKFDEVLDSKTDARLKKLEERLKKNPNDVDAIAQQKQIHDELMYKQQAKLLPRVKKMEQRINSGDRTITQAEYKQYYRDKRNLEGTRRNLDVPQYDTPYKPLTPKQKKALLEKKKNRTLTQDEWKHLEWDRRFNNRRRRGVKRFWSNERKLLKSTGQGTRNWTPQQKADILAGKTPKYDGVPIEGHHRYNALDHPQIADDPLNIYGASNDEHFSGWHGGNYQNDTFGFPQNESFGEQF